MSTPHDTELDQEPIAGSEDLAASSPESSVATEPASLWADVRDAIRGVQRDYTQGSIPRAVILLSVPMVLEMVMESVFGLVDVFFVARLGASAVAAVALTESMLTIVFSVAIGLSAATTAMVARRIGEKRIGDAGRAAVQALLLGLLAAIVTGVIGVLMAPRLLALMGAEADVIEGGSTYTTIVLGSSLVIYYLFLINAVFRGAGDAAFAMRALWLANGINIVLDPCLIFGLGPFPELGLTGAAIATAIGRGCGVLYQLWVLSSGRARFTIGWPQLKLDLPIAARLMRVSSTGILQFLVATSSWVGMVKILSTFGSSVLAGYAIAIRLVVVAILPSWGMCNAAATLVGQNLGAGRPQRAERSVWLTGFYNLCFLGLVGVVFVIFARPLVGLFTDDPEVLRYGTQCLRWVSFGYLFYAYGMVMPQAFNGAGDTVTPTYINLLCFWLVQIPLAYFLALRWGFGPLGVFAAIPIAEALMAVVAILAFRRGKWKTQVI
nr:probable multidrug resistance protein NorM [Nerophis lumbriciformis]